jgi:hypothetical protein
VNAWNESPTQLLARARRIHARIDQFGRDDQGVDDHEGYAAFWTIAPKILDALDDALAAETSRACLVCVDCRVDDGVMVDVTIPAHGVDVTVSAHAVDVGVLSAVVRAALVNAGIVSADRAGVDVERVVEGDLSYVTRAVAGSVAAHLELHARRPVPAVATRRVDEHADRASAWCDYRNDFGVTDIDTAHKAFLAGWDAAHGRTDESVLR